MGDLREGFAQPGAGSHEEIGVLPFTDSWREAWDRLVDASPMGTVLHSRRFLDYHGSRFKDASLVFVSEPTDRLLAVLPAVEDGTDRSRVNSHSGSSFGGLVLARSDPPLLERLLWLAMREWARSGYRKLIYRPVPALFTGQPDESAHLVLLRHGRVVQADLWNVIRLHDGFRPRQRRKLEAIRSAKSRGVLRVRQAADVGDWERFHGGLSQNLMARHGITPVHSLAELVEINSRLSGQNRLFLATSEDDEVLAGVWTLAYIPMTWHVQYNFNSPRGRRLNALDVLLHSVIETAMREGAKQFSFGRNTLRDGWSYNASLMRYKLRFGGGVVIVPTFEVDLAKLA